MKVALIVAFDNKRGIGKNNDLMWHLPADMRFFKETTTGQIVVMGRKNYESIPAKFRPLPNRENVVLTRNGVYDAPTCSIFNSLEDCLEHFKNEKERTVFIIGGGQIYKEALLLNCLDEMYITHVHGDFDADVFFPEFDESKFEKSSLFTYQSDEKHTFGFEIVKYVRK